MKEKLFAVTLLLLAVVGGILTATGLLVETDLFGKLLILLLPVPAIALLVIHQFRIRRGDTESWDRLLDDALQKEKNQ